MAFESWQEIWRMGGHGVYVWLAYGGSALVLLGMLLAPVCRARRLRRRDRRPEDR